MSRRGTERTTEQSARLAICAVLLAAAAALPAQAPAPAEPQPVVLDRVVAVVNRHAILASEIDEEIRLSVLDPAQNAGSGLTRSRALEQLISRTLIEQQIRRGDEQAAEPSQAELDARLAQIRGELPFCVRRNCASADGWKTVLATQGLTPERVAAYLRYRLQILAFIELRFRQGIRIEPEEIKDYYAHTLLPQYAPGETVPALDQVKDRIEEILLEQRVSLLFDDWLANLRKQGDVEVLDPELEPAASPQNATPEASGTKDSEKGAAR